MEPKRARLSVSGWKGIGRPPFCPIGHLYKTCSFRPANAHVRFGSQGRAVRVFRYRTEAGPGARAELVIAMGCRPEPRSVTPSPHAHELPSAQSARLSPALHDFVAVSVDLDKRPERIPTIDHPHVKRRAVIPDLRQLAPSSRNDAGSEAFDIRIGNAEMEWTRPPEFDLIRGFFEGRINRFE